MPEISELKYMSNFVKQSCKGKLFHKIGTSTVTKNPIPDIDFDNFSISSQSRGKEMKITLKSQDKLKTSTLVFSMGMTGHWVFVDSIVDHCHLWFKEKEGKFLCFVDPRRFGKWKQQEIWSENRGSDPTTEFSAFKKCILEHKYTTLAKKPLYDSLLDQKYFNGVGNYLRAEILHRAYKDCRIKPNTIFSALSKKEVSLLCLLTKKVCKESYDIGGGEFMSWKNPEGKGSK